MSVATTHTVALDGATGHLIEVQVDVSTGVVGTSLVGRPDVALQESRDRVKMAINNSAGSDPMRWPSSRRVTILLSPADLPKRGTHFDLAIAVGVIATGGEVPAAALEASVFIGELALSGALRPVAGVLPMVLAAAERGMRRVFVPEPQASEAAMVPGMTVLGVRSLGQVIAELTGAEVPTAPAVVARSRSALLSWRGQDLRDDVDLADLVGLEDVKYAVEVAAAGGHHLMLSGPRGCGKTSIAERIPSILPDLAPDEALEVAAIQSLAGTFDPEAGLHLRPPYVAPHHDASAASLLGGGTGRVRPGAISRALHGVVFLDEFALFHADVVEALRQPLESGVVTVARGDETATYPARAMVVLAANPCPCGGYHGDQSASTCTCSAPDRRHYSRKLNGPVIDRIDVWRRVEPAPAHVERDRFARADDSATVRARVSEARARQQDRYAGCGWRLNATVPGAALQERWPLTPEADEPLQRALAARRLSRRGAVRVHRVAWTVADLAGHDSPTVGDVETALALRQGESLSLGIVGRAG
jgi:magnesium chelatase family protein